MPSRARIVTWNGKDVPPGTPRAACRSLHCRGDRGRGAAAVAKEEAGIEAALESYARAGLSMASAPARSSTQLSGVEGRLRNQRPRGVLRLGPPSEACDERSKSAYFGFSGIGGRPLIFSATFRQAPIRSETSLSSTSRTPWYSVRFRISWHFDRTRHTSGPRPSVSGRT